MITISRSQLEARMVRMGMSPAEAKACVNTGMQDHGLTQDGDKLALDGLMKQPDRKPELN